MVNMVNLQKNILTILQQLGKRSIIVRVDNAGGSLKWKVTLGRQTLSLTLYSPTISATSHGAFLFVHT